MFEGKGAHREEVTTGRGSCRRLQQDVSDRQRGPLRMFTMLLGFVGGSIPAMRSGMEAERVAKVVLERVGERVQPGVSLVEVVGRFELRTVVVTDVSAEAARAQIEVARLAHRHPTWRIGICVAALALGIIVMACTPEVAWPIASALGVLEVAFGGAEIASRMRG